MFPTLALTLGLILLWLLSSGYFLILIIALGIASISLVVWLAHRMDVVDHESHPVHMALRGLTYFPWLIVEIIKSNLDVAIAIVQGAKAIAPSTIQITASQRSDVGRVTYANSITLTPGTVTMHVDGTIFLVHALTRNSAKGLQTGEMDARVTRLEGPVKIGTEGVG